MEKHIFTRFDDELNNLQNMVVDMANLCEKQLHAISAFLRQDPISESLRDIVNVDALTNQYHIDINKECVRLIAKRSPVASDLRFITACDRIATDLERIGDENCKIAYLLEEEPIDVQKDKIWKELYGTIRLAKAMLNSCIGVLSRLDAEAAEALLKDDDDLDTSYNSVTRQLMSYMIEDNTLITKGIDVLMAAKSLERIGDHCINIAESIIYAIDGEDVRMRRDFEVANKH